MHPRIKSKLKNRREYDITLNKDFDKSLDPDISSIDKDNNVYEYARTGDLVEVGLVLTKGNNGVSYTKLLNILICKNKIDFIDEMLNDLEVDESFKNCLMDGLEKCDSNSENFVRFAILRKNFRQIEKLYEITGVPIEHLKKCKPFIDELVKDKLEIKRWFNEVMKKNNISIE
jgi:hypothetical protein